MIIVVVPDYGGAGYVDGDWIFVNLKITFCSSVDRQHVIFVGPKNLPYDTVTKIYKILSFESVFTIC